MVFLSIHWRGGIVTSIRQVGRSGVVVAVVVDFKTR